MNKKAADTKARYEYVQFEERRREHLETDGALETIRSLAQIAKTEPKK